MKARIMADILALKFDKSNDFAFKQSLIYDIISYRAILIKQQIDKNNKVDDRYLVNLKNISVVKVDGCYYSNVAIPDWIPIYNKSFSNIEIYDDDNCCIHRQLDEISLTRLPYITSKNFDNKIPFYILDNGKIKLFNVNQNVKYVNVRFVPSNYYQYAELQNNLNGDENIVCVDEGDINIEDTFRDAIEMFMLKTYSIYKGTQDGDINVAADKQ